MITELIARTFALRNAVHIRHWATKSYAEHVALGELYDGMIEAIDAIVEAYQGLYGPIDSVPLADMKDTGDIVAVITADLDFIEAHRNEITEGSDSLGNLVDSLANLYSKTVFLLGLK